MFLKRLCSAPLLAIGSAGNRRSVHGGQSIKVIVVGASGGIGQPLSMLIKTNPLVSKLSLFDLKSAVGVAADVAHIDTSSFVQGFDCKENLKKALGCADIVVIPAGMPRKPGQTRNDLFKVNADVVAEVMDAVAVICPTAFLAIITNPVNSTVPVAAEVLKKHDVYDPARLFGVTTLDIVRARKFIGDKMMVDPKRVKIDVVGGHSATTIIPVISYCEPEFKFDHDDVVKVTERIKNCGTDVVEAKAGAGSATLSMAYAGASFVNTLLRALSGESGVTDIAYVESCLTEAQFFASKVAIGTTGITDFPALPEFNRYEKELVCTAMPYILEDIKKGVEFEQAFEITKPEKNKCK